MLNYEFPPLGGGGGAAAYKLAKGFVKLGYDVDIITTWFKGLEKFEKINGVNIYRIKVIGRKELPTATMISLLTFPIKAYKKACELCENNNYLFILSYFAIPSGILGKKLSKKYNIKHILNIVGGDIYDPTKKTSPHKNFLLRKEVNSVMNSADVIISISSDTKKRAEQYYKPNKEIHPILIPYELYKFKPISRKSLGLKEDLFYTISIGRLVKRKGFDFLIKSIAKINNNKIHALIIGDGPEKENLQNIAKELNISDRIHFLGSVSEKDKFQYLSNSNVYVLSSVHEGFGIVLQEAMQVGLPIIATNNGGQTDFIKEGKNGFLIDYSNKDSLKEKIEKLSKDKKLRMKFSDFNKKEIKNFETSKICKKYLELER